MNYLVQRLNATRAGVEEIFAARIEQLRSPWSAYAVFDRSGMVYGNGLTDGLTSGSGSVDGSGTTGAAGPAAPTVDTAFRIASCTKSFTAAAALLLRDRGRLSLDDPIDRYLRVGECAGADGLAPSIGQLLSMSGGLPTDDAWADRQESMTDAAFDRLAGSGFRFVRRPGSGYEYSNLGYALVGRAVQVAAGRPYTEFVTDELLTPLGLDQIAYQAEVPAADGVAVGFRRGDQEWVPLPFTGPGAFSPIGGLFATPRALARWACWLAAGSCADDDAVLNHAVPNDAVPNHAATNGAVLSPQSRREMATARIPIDGGSVPRGYGYGLVVEQSPRHGRILAHSGGYPGFGAHFRWHADSGIGIVAMENATYSGTIGAAEAALTLMLQETAAPDTEPELWPETIRARDSVENLLRAWDSAAAAALFADNVEQDEPLSLRRDAIAAQAAAAGIAGSPIVPLRLASPFSISPAHLVWTSPGAGGSLRCEITLTPQSPPLVQTLTVRPG